MDELDQICDQIRQDFERKNVRRDAALTQARQLTRHASLAVRAIHREEVQEAQAELQSARELVQAMREGLKDDPDLYFTGYTQDAIKEYVEAQLTVALILNQPLPTPAELGAEYPAYLAALAETLGELRRRCLDLLRPGYSNDVERLLSWMDDIFTQLVTMDFPDAITQGLRRRTDLARGIIERTRADITLSFRQSEMEAAINRLSDQLNHQAED